jgi:hypothetical protein
MVRTMTIRRIGILSLAKLQAVIMALVGLIFGILYGFFFVVLGAVSYVRPVPTGGGAVMVSGRGGGGLAVIGLLMVILIPILYGLAGFAAGALGALIYNVAAGMMGGLEIDVDEAIAPYEQPKSGY